VVVEQCRAPSLLARLRDLEDGLVATVAGALDVAGVGGPDPYLRSRVVLVTIESLVHRLLATEQPLHTDDVVDEIARLLDAYLRA
jgi:hypothetical protein